MLPFILALFRRIFSRKKQPSQAPSPDGTQPQGKTPLLIWRPSTLDMLRQAILQNESDEEGMGAKVIRIILILATYILPFLLAYFIGKQIGDYFSGLFNPNDGWSAGVHISAWAGEAALAVLVVTAATARRLRRRNTGYLADLLISGSMFILFTVISSVVLWGIDSSHIKPHYFIEYAAVVFLVSMVPCVDVASFLYLSLVGPLFRSPR